jgi:septal ring factor EnvC (AmiA/AmiB activator)
MYINLTIFILLTILNVFSIYLLIKRSNSLSRLKKDFEQTDIEINALNIKHSELQDNIKIKELEIQNLTNALVQLDIVKTNTEKNIEDIGKTCQNFYDQ